MSADTTVAMGLRKDAAQKLYERAGFIACGQLQRELNAHASFIDELSVHKQIF